MSARNLLSLCHGAATNYRRSCKQRATILYDDEAAM
jgi:hypothetical protein